jgi:hypothetical protein
MTAPAGECAAPGIGVQKGQQQPPFSKWNVSDRGSVRQGVGGSFGGLAWDEQAFATRGTCT